VLLGGCVALSLEPRRINHSTVIYPSFRKIVSRGNKLRAIGGNKMDDVTIAKIQRDPNYIKLVSDRKSFGWTLAIIMLAIYYGYIAIVAFAPSIIAIPLFGSITVGIVLGAAIILAAIVLTGVYVLRANSEYDDLTKAIVAAASAGSKSAMPAGGATSASAAVKSAAMAGGKK
jgi:uncharacterized membrane protein (DUF485 family)